MNTEKGASVFVEIVESEEAPHVGGGGEVATFLFRLLYT